MFAGDNNKKIIIIKNNYTLLLLAAGNHRINSLGPVALCRCLSAGLPFTIFFTNKNNYNRRFCKLQAFSTCAIMHINAVQCNFNVWK